MNRTYALMLSAGIVALMLTLTGCGKAEHHHDHQELPSQSVTHWTARTELFSENRMLVAGQPTPFAVHLTELTGFKPITEGQAVLEFRDGQGKLHRFAAEKPTNPGIFRPVATLPAAGRYTLTLTLKGPIEDVHELGEIQVYADPHAAEKAAPSEKVSGAAISFLKEQQWKTTFDVEEVGVKSLSESIAVQGQIRAPVAAAVPVTAPASGQVTAAESGFPLLGTYVWKGQPLVAISPEGSARGNVVLSPVSGVVTMAHARLGDRVEEGRRLFDLVDLSRVWAEARVYEPDVARIPPSPTAAVELLGAGRQVPALRFISAGGVLEAGSRTVPIVFEVENVDNVFRIGNAVTVYIKTQQAELAPVIPVSALVDEDGTMVAYVQVEGEAFERRPLALGIREGDWVQVVEGLKPGERVVTQGAYLVRLAAASSQIPAHGHAH